MTTLRSGTVGTNTVQRPMLIQVMTACRLGTASTAPVRTFKVDIARPS
ncbi:hypothetical protein [Deinococcus sp.]|nr:hypothetical protein [Deinococcus sp.]